MKDKTKKIWVGLVGTLLTYSWVQTMRRPVDFKLLKTRVHLKKFTKLKATVISHKKIDLILYLGKNNCNSPLSNYLCRPRSSSGYHTRLWIRGSRVRTRPGSMDFFQSVKNLYDFLRKGSKAVGPVSYIYDT